jgi:hypothetical protein
MSAIFVLQALRRKKCKPTATDSTGLLGLGCESARACCCCWRFLRCVGLSGPSVSLEESAELLDSSSSFSPGPVWGKSYSLKKGSSVMSSPGSRSPASRSPSWYSSVPATRFLGTIGAEYARILRFPGRPAVATPAWTACALLAFSLRSLRFLCSVDVDVAREGALELELGIRACAARADMVSRKAPKGAWIQNAGTELHCVT